MALVSIVFPDRPGDVRSLIGVTEDLSLAVPATVRRTRSGAPRVDGPVYGQKWAIRLSGSGDRQQLPELSDLRIGDPIRIASSCWWTHPVVGAAADVPRVGAIALPRPIAIRSDGYKAAEWKSFDRAFRYRIGDADWSSYQLALRLASFQGPALDRLVLWYRPVFSCIVTALSASGTSSARDQGWSLDAEEEYPS